MKKQLTIILSMTLLGLFFLAFTQENRNMEIHGAGKMKSLTETGSLISLVRDSDVVVKKQPVVTQPRDKGIGPVKELKLGPIHPKLVNDGKALFVAKCTICHSLDQKVIGPPLRNVAKNRTPEYIMNMILNPTNMEKDDPIVKELHKKYIATPMTNQEFPQDQARSLLEYLRSVVK